MTHKWMTQVGWLAVGAALAFGCSKAVPPRQRAAAPQPTLAPVVVPKAAQAVDLAPPVTVVLAKDITPLTPDLPLPATATLALDADVVTGVPPAGAPDLALAMREVVDAARVPGMPALRNLLTEESLQRLEGLAAGAPLPITPSVIAARFAGRLAGVHFAGGRAAVVARQPDGTQLTSWWYLRSGAWRLDLVDSRPLLPPTAGPDDSLNRPVALQQVLDGVPGSGGLALRLQTQAGPIVCRLHTQLVPDAVAHLAALVSGQRAHRVVESKVMTTRWEASPFYRQPAAGVVYAQDASFVAFGCPFGAGSGHAGFAVADQLTTQLRHDRPGVLSLVADAPNTASSRLAISLQPRPLRDDRDTIVGQCEQLDALTRLQRLPQRDQQIQRVELVRLP